MALWACVALCGLSLGAAVWLRGALTAEFARGEAHGRALAAAAGARALENARREADRAFAQTQADVAALEMERDALQGRYDALEQQISPAAGADGLCLGPDVVRALAAIADADRAGAARP